MHEFKAAGVISVVVRKGYDPGTFPNFLGRKDRFTGFETIQRKIVLS